MNTLLPNLLYGGGGGGLHYKRNKWNIKGQNCSASEKLCIYIYIYIISQITSLTTLFEKYVFGFCYSIYVFLFSGKISNMK